MKPTHRLARKAPVSQPRAVAYGWDDLALHKTWRSAGSLGVLLGLLNTVWAPVPGLALAAVGAWAYAKGCPQCMAAVGWSHRR